MILKNRSPIMVVYISWGILVLFYMYQYFLRVSPSVMVHDLRCEFSLNAEQFAFIPAIYLYAYGILQIPIGLMLDSTGVKRTMLISVFICTLGTVLFFTSHNVYMLYLSRFLIGAGSAAAFITPLKVIGDHIQEGKKGLFMGLTLACGTIGPLIAGKPLSLMIQEFGWRDTGLFSAAGGIIILICIVMFIPKRSIVDHHVKKLESLSGISSNIKKLANNRLLFIYAILAFAFYTPLAVLSDTWGTTFLMEKYQISKAIAAECTSFIFIGLCVGCFIIPAYFERKNLLNQGIKIALVLMCGIFFLILTKDFSLPIVKLLFFCFGFCAGAEMLCFTGVSNSAQDGMRGLALGFANTINMVGGAILQQVVGLFLEYFWSGHIDEKGLHHYIKEDFEKTFMFYVVIYIVSIILAHLFLKENKK